MEDKYASTKMCGNIKKYKACTYVDKNDFYVESGNERKYSGNTFEAPVSVNKSSSSSDINGVFHPTCSFSALLDDISHQRGQLKPSELDEFDRQWGIDPSGELTRSNRRYWCNVASNTESLMRQELQWVSSEARSKIDKLRIATDEHLGLELLLLADILQQHTYSVIFAAKSEEDFRHSQVVTRQTKLLCSLLVFALNLFFAFYSIVHGYQKGINWQMSYLAGCVSHLATEVLLFETMECIWMQFLIPSLVSSEVERVNRVLSDVLMQICTQRVAFPRQLPHPLIQLSMLLTIYSYRPR